MDSTVVFLEFALGSKRVVQIQLFDTAEDDINGLIAVFDDNEVTLEISCQIKFLRMLSTLTSSIGIIEEKGVSFRMNSKSVVLANGGKSVVIPLNDGSWNLFKSNLKKALKDYHDYEQHELMAKEICYKRYCPEGSEYNHD